MNLLEMMKQEVFNLKLTDELEIAYYLYMRTGQIFEYNPYYFFLSLAEKREYNPLNINLENIEVNEFICFEWADIMESLCENFGLKAEKVLIEKEGNSHAYIELDIQNEKYKLDLTANYEDITLSKLGLKVTHFNKMVDGEIFFSFKKKKIEMVEEKFYKLGIKSNEFQNVVIQKQKRLLMLKKMLDEKIGKVCSEEEYIYQVYRVIADLINSFKNDLGYISGAKSISYLLDFFAKGYVSKSSYFYDNKQKIYIKVDLVNHNGQLTYFAYQKMCDGKYKFQEVPKIYVDSLKSIYSSKCIENSVVSKPNYVINLDSNIKR